MPYVPLPQNTIRDNILRDQRNLNDEADTSKDSDNYVRANATGNAVAGLYAHQQWVFKQIFADTADDENVLRHAGERGMSLTAAVGASGPVKLAGTVGLPFIAGLSVRRDDGVTYTTTNRASPALRMRQRPGGWSALCASRLWCA